MKIINLGKIFILFFIIFLAFVLRYKNYNQVPVPGTSMDEYSYSWVGLSLITQRYPIGISRIEGYKNNEKKYVNPDNLINISISGPFVFNYPWFDHPPVLGLMTGGYSFLRGARVIEDIQLRIIRQPMIILGSFSVFLLFILINTNFGFMAAAFSSLIYATAPLSVVGSRMVQGENVLIFFWLLSLVFLNLYLKKDDLYKLFLAGIFSGISIVCKLSGIVSLISGVILLWFLGNFKNKKIDILIFGTVALSFLSLFFIYGYFYDWQVFKNIIVSNSNRFYGLGSNSLFNLFTQSKLTANNNIYDAWPLLGWISFLGILSRKNKKYLWLVVPLMSYLVVYIFFGSYNYGWYTFPFLPFLAMSVGIFLTEMIEKKYLSRVFLLLLTAIGVEISSLITLDRFQLWSKYWRLGIPILFLGIFFLDYKFKKNNNKIIYLIGIFLLLIGIVLNIVYVFRLNADYWYTNIW